MKRFSRAIIPIVFLTLGFLLFPSSALAGTDGTYGLQATAKAADLDKYGTDVPALVGNIIGTALSLVSVIFFILAVYGGFRMMLARGKDDEFSKGKDILIHAVIGLIIILASYAITSFMFNSVKPGAGGGGNTPTPAPTQDIADGSIEIGGVCGDDADCKNDGLCSDTNECVGESDTSGEGTDTYYCPNPDDNGCIENDSSSLNGVDCQITVIACLADIAATIGVCEDLCATLLEDTCEVVESETGACVWNGTVCITLDISCSEFTIPQSCTADNGCNWNPAPV